MRELRRLAARSAAMYTIAMYAQRPISDADSSQAGQRDIHACRPWCRADGPSGYLPSLSLAKLMIAGNRLHRLETSILAESLSWTTMAKRKDGGMRPHRTKLDKVRHRFYEPLILLSLFNMAPGGGGHAGGSSEAHSSYPHAKDWQNLLDDLSSLCDFKHGGMSVCAVAAAEANGIAHFWFCSKFSRAYEHLKWLLEQVSTLIRNGGDRNGEEIRETMIRETIHFAREKVQHYRKELRKNVELAIREGGPWHDDRERKSAAFAWATRGTLEPVQICEAALATDLHDLPMAVPEPVRIQSYGALEMIQHYVQKLQGWHRRVGRLMTCARLHASRVEGAGCTWLPLPEPGKMPAADHRTTLRDVLVRMLPVEDQDKVDEYHSRLTARIDMESCFQDAYTSPQLALAMHAEVFLLEHLHGSRITMLGNVKYIGCSKPSCYCCSLYIQNHPGNFVRRPSHGTAWPKWNIPLIDAWENPKSQQHTIKIMSAVTAHLRRDVLEEIDKRFPRSRRGPDSMSYSSQIE